MAKKNAEADVYEYEAEQKNDKPVKAKFDFTKLNTLAVVSLASAVSGVGAVAAVITGHISLAQIKKSEEKGRTLAIIGVAAGYAGIAIWILGTLGVITLGIWGARNGFDLGNRGGFGHMDMNGDNGGQFQMGQLQQTQPSA